jgi:hypothetical protein
MTRKETFKLGHVYSIEYHDHWSSDRVYRDDIDPDCRLRTRGVCILITPRSIILEHQSVTTDHHATNKRSDHNGILRSAIIKVQHFGPEKM